MKNILILGNKGYIGSYLEYSLSERYNITGIDIGWFVEEKCPTDYKNLTEQYLDNYDAVILLAGHSAVRQCETDMSSSFKNNVANFVDLLSKINTQKLIYASSSSIYGSVLREGEIANENHPEYVSANYYDLSKYIIDQYATLSGKECYGLRFGTVNGFSPRLRTDIMINAMVNSALSNGHVKVFEGGIHRPILGIRDLGRAMEAIINSDKQNAGIYNLASLNSTSGEIGKQVSEIMGCELIEDTPLTANKSKPYDFQIDSSKFIETYNFNFQETVETITLSLKNNFDKCVKFSRHYEVKYP